jgi:hypothetical protein
MFLDRDLDFWSQQCLQCGFRVELKNLDEFKESVLVGGSSSKKPDGGADTI